MRTPRWLATAALVLLWPGMGNGQDMAAVPALHWVRLEGAEDCMSPRALAERVEAAVGRVLFVSATEALLSVEGHVARPEPGTFRVVLAVTGADGVQMGQRELVFRGRDCTVIEESVALVIAVTLYPESGLVGPPVPLDPVTRAELHALFGDEAIDPDPAELPQAAPSPPSGRDALEPPTRGSRAPAEQDPSPDEPPTWHVAATAALALGSQPGLGVGYGAQVSLTWPGLWPLLAGFEWFTPTYAKVREGHTARARVALFHLHAGACPAGFGFGPFEGGFCLALEVESVSLEPQGFGSDAGKRQMLLANALANLGLRLGLLGPLYAHVNMWAALPLVQQTFRYQDLEGAPQVLHRTRPLGLRAQFALGLRF